MLHLSALIGALSLQSATNHLHKPDVFFIPSHPNPSDRIPPFGPTEDDQMVVVYRVHTTHVTQFQI